MTTEQIAQSEDDSVDDSTDSWADATEKFVQAVGDDLGDRFAPQIKALRAIAAQLDVSEKYEATLAADYARMHRWLLNKTGARGSGPDPDEAPDLLEMLEQNPGAFWRP